MSPPDIGIGPAIRRAREAAGLSQAELARRLGLTQPTVGDIERGRKGVSLENAIAYASALGVSPATLDARLAGPRGERRSIIPRYVIEGANSVAGELEAAGRDSAANAIRQLVAAARVEGDGQGEDPGLIPPELHEQYLRGEIDVRTFAGEIGCSTAALYRRMNDQGLRKKRGRRSPGRESPGSPP